MAVAGGHRLRWLGRGLMRYRCKREPVPRARIIQSASERERRPVLLKSCTASSASAPDMASMRGNICRAMSSSRVDSGPQRSSAHATADVPGVSFPLSHALSLDSSAVPGCRALTMKLVSRWTMLSDRLIVGRHESCPSRPWPWRHPGPGFVEAREMLPEGSFSKLGLRALTLPEQSTAPSPFPAAYRVRQPPIARGQLPRPPLSSS
jgi:hypothetical protein